MSVTFDSSINLGAILNAAVLLVGFVVAFTRIGGRIDLLTLRVGSLEKSLGHTEANTKTVTRMDERLMTAQRDISGLRKDVDGLKRGEGWITHPRKVVDGEY